MNGAVRPASDLIGRVDVEWLAIRAGVKPASRVTISLEHAAQHEERARREGFAVARAADLVEFPGRPPAVILYVSPDAARARALVEVEAPLLPPIPGRVPIEVAAPLHAELGRLLGFPPCCVDEFGVRLQRGVTRRLDRREAHEDFVAAECAVRVSERFLGRLNDLSPDRRARIVTFYPCRYDCAAAADYAGAVYDHAQRHEAGFAAALREALVGEFSIGASGQRGRASEISGESLTVEFAEF